MIPLQASDVHHAGSPDAQPGGPACTEALVRAVAAVLHSFQHGQRWLPRCQARAVTKGVSDGGKGWPAVLACLSQAFVALRGLPSLRRQRHVHLQQHLTA